MHLPPGGDPAKEHQDFQRDVVGFVYMSAKFWSADFAHAVQVPHRLQPFFYNKSMKQQHIGVHKPSVPLSVMEELYSHLLSISATGDCFQPSGDFFLLFLILCPALAVVIRVADPVRSAMRVADPVVASRGALGR